VLFGQLTRNVKKHERPSNHSPFVFPAAVAVKIKCFFCQSVDGLQNSSFRHIETLLVHVFSCSALLSPCSRRQAQHVLSAVVMYDHAVYHMMN